MQEYKKIVLKNGIRLLLIPDNSRRVVTSLVLFGVGSRYETEESAGISHVLEHMHYKGTKKRPSPLEVSEFIENIGGEHNAFTSKEYTGYYAKAASKNLEKSLDFLSDILTASLFRSKDLEQEKRVILQELDMYEDLPAEVANNNFEKTLYGANALGRDIIGYKESIKSIRREDLVAYRNRFYTGQNTVIVLSGNLEGRSDADLVSIIERYFDLSTKSSDPYIPITLNDQKNYSLINKKTEQSHLVVGFKGVANDHPDRYVLRLLALILGGSMSSRMFSEIREKRGLAYAVRSATNNYLDSGSFETYAGIPHDRSLEAIEAVLGEYRRIKDTIKQSEVERAKEIIYGRLLINNEDSSEVASHFGMGELLAGRIRTLEEVAEIYQKITLADLERAARQYFIDETLCLSFVGKAPEINDFEKVFKL